MNRFWLFSIARKRMGRVSGASLGVALTVALLATLGLFLVNSTASMTSRAVSAVPIDWQVEAVPGADLGLVKSSIMNAAPVKALHQVEYASTDGFQATTGSTVQTTGPGKVIAFDSQYLKDFPKEVRWLLGAHQGVLIAQQTAANLHVGPGDQVTIKRKGLAPMSVTVAGVVDLPDADALFQGVGLPKQAAPQAPPDNVLILPNAQFHQVFDAQKHSLPNSVRTQFHVRLNHLLLPSQPTDALTQVNGQAKNLEVHVAGQALVSNNLSARLDAVKGDSLYATVLFLFLGLPGVVLAAILTLSMTASGASRRQAEQALLRVRGASTRRILKLAASEAALVGIVGIALGIGGASLFAQYALPHFSSSNVWGVSSFGAAFVGLVLSFSAVLLPAWLSAKGKTVSASRLSVGRRGQALWQRYYLDGILLVASALVFWQTASTGYQIVLAPEGVPATSVDYKAFLAPALFWAGSALLIMRLSLSFIASQGALTKGAVKPLSGRLSNVVMASMSFQRRRITMGIAMTALAVSFASSTAIFNTTYNAQARVDAQLTNGADVTVFGTSAEPAGPHLSTLQALPGVVAAQPMMHRFAYVGADLQDLFAINPHKIESVTYLSNAFFNGGTAKEMLSRLAQKPDAILLAEETVHDFQLKQGDQVNLRLMNAKDHQYHTVPFTFVGVAREFPTAPKDSFLVVNASYIAKMTGNPAQEYVLLHTSGDPTKVAVEAKQALASVPALQVKDLTGVSHIIGSSLTAVDLSSLTKIELAFAIVMAAAAAGLMLVLGFNDRRRNFAVLTAIGAKPHQLGAFLWSEGVLVVLGGIVLGLCSGALVAWMLVKLLTGVFDPPPEVLSIPWYYLATLLVLITVSVLAAVRYTAGHARKDAVEVLRDF